MTELLPMLKQRFDLTVDSLHEIGAVDLAAAEDALRELSHRESQMQWYLGDLWLLIENKFHGDYADRVDVLKQRYERVVEYARVARAFPSRRESQALKSSTWRISELKFGHHRVCAAIVDPHERMAWLTDAQRHSWTVQRLTEALHEENRHREQVGQRPLVVRPIGQDILMVQQQADLCRVTPEEWVTEGLRWLAREGSPHMATVLEAA